MKREEGATNESFGREFTNNWNNFIETLAQKTLPIVTAKTIAKRLFRTLTFILLFQLVYIYIYVYISAVSVNQP